MNKVLFATILVCGLATLDSPEAAAHDEKAGQYRPPSYTHAYDYRRDPHRRYYHGHSNYRDVRQGKRHKRAYKLPKWLKHDRSFRRWLNVTGLDRNPYLTWHQLFDIYVWEQRYLRIRRY